VDCGGEISGAWVFVCGRIKGEDVLLLEMETRPMRRRRMQSAARPFT